VEVVRELLIHGAKVGNGIKNGWKLLHAAAAKDHVEVVRELLKHGAKVESANIHANIHTSLQRSFKRSRGSSPRVVKTWR